MLFFSVFQHPYHFHPCSDYLSEGPSTGTNFGSAWLKFGTDRLFTLQFFSEPNPLFGTRAIFPLAVPDIFCSVNRALVLFALPDVKITGYHIFENRIQTLYRINSNFYKLSFHVNQRNLLLWRRESLFHFLLK